MKKLLFILSLMFPFLVFSQTITENYVKKTNYQVPLEIIDEHNATDDQKVETVNYIDGLGRVKQNISMRAGGNREDLIIPVLYDGLGRQPKDYLPLPLVSNEGNYIVNPLTPLHDFYYNGFEGDRHPFDINPYSEKRFEDSPLSRVLELGSPGKDWEIDPNSDTDHTVKFAYETSDNNDAVINFSVNFQGGNTTSPQLEYNQNYGSGLYKNVVKDENWTSGDNNTTQEFINKLGQTILKRNFNDNVRHDTYYVYDDFGNLAYVISPKASDQIIVNNTLATNYPEILNDLGYQYIYDGRNRLIEKKIPGKGWEYIVYNNLDQPVLTQDVIQRSKNEWSFTKYDKYGRIVYTGISKSNYNVSVIRTFASLGTQFESQTNTPTQIGSTDPTNVYYTNSSWTSETGEVSVLTINYYDKYVDMGINNLPNIVYNIPLINDAKGLPTVSRVRVLGTSQWILSFTGYDNKGRPIYTRSINDYLDSNNIVQSKLDFTGKILESTTIHVKDGNDAITINDYFFYDHMGRVLSHKQKIDDSPVQLIAENNYNEIGQLVLKNVGGETAQDGYTDITDANVTYDGVITKTGTPDAWDAGAKTIGAITENGGIQFTVLQDSHLLTVGLLKTNQNMTNWNDGYDYGLYYSNLDSDSDGFKDVKLIINGVIQSNIISGYNTGNSFSIDRLGDLIRFKKGGATIYTITDSEEVALVGKVGFKNDGASISGFQIFGDAISKKLQNVDYTYNIRGWLTDINNLGAPQGFGLDDDLFHFRINYNLDIEGSAGDSGKAVPLYNGNISQTIWKSKNDDTQKRGYGYKYDNLNRIKTAYFRKGLDLNDLTINNSVWGINYDKNGNINNILRNGANDDGTSYGLWDDLSYAYEGNKLLNVKDNSNESTFKNDGFYDGNIKENTGVNDYDYDANGNMTIDTNKNIGLIKYNHLNLPTSIDFGTVGDHQDEIHYTYDATGLKLDKTFFDTTNNTTVTTQYVGNFIYSDNETTGTMKLQFFNHPEGYIEPVANTLNSVKGFSLGPGGGSTSYSSYNYVFQYKDHLGNVRLSYADKDLNGSINSTNEIIEESNFYPFGLEHKGYNNVVNGVENDYHTFNGKEHDKSLNLNWHDFGARNYDASLGRWMNIDPLADKMRNNSPYNYAFNNPVLFVDPDGMFPIIIHVRSFAPFKHFGAGLWHGDNRSFSRNPRASSRLHQITHYETDTRVSSTQARGSISSSRYGAWAYSEASLKDYSSGNNINSHMFGNNDAVLPAGMPPGSVIPPDGGPTWAIDVHTNLNVEVSDLDGGNQLLSISGQVSGDTFPNAEAFVSDAEGNSVWLGTFATQSGPNKGPFFTLAGDDNDPMININIGIVTDKNGIFTGVQVGDKTISLDQWNKDTTGPMSVDEFKKNHKDLYNQLFGSK